MVLYVMVLQGMELLRISSYTAKTYSPNRHAPRIKEYKVVEG